MRARCRPRGEGGGHGGHSGNQQRQSGGAPLHRDRGPVPGRQDHAARSDPRPHRRAAAARHRRSRQHGRRRQPGGARAPDEHRAFGRLHQFSRRHLHVPGLPGLGRVRPGHALGAAAGRRRDRGLRGRREEDPAAATGAARARRTENPALPVPQQDRQGRQARARDHRAAAAGLARAAGAAANPDLEERHHRGLRRSRARARLRLPRARREQGRPDRGRERRPQEGGALLDAGEARRPRRQADGAVARGYRAAARQGVRRSRQGAARGRHLPGADRLGHAHQRRAAPDEGLASRGAGRRRHQCPPRPEARAPMRSASW